MATGEDNRTGANVTRRGLLGAVGVATVAPVVQAMPWAAERRATWGEGLTPYLAVIREAYLGKIERFAETLRPRFESGELRAFAERDDDGIRGAEGWGPASHRRDSPHRVLEDLVRDHLGLRITETDHGNGTRSCDGDEVAAHLVLAASPHGRTSEVCGGEAHPCHAAVDAATWDVIAHARARGWYVPSADECEDPLDAP